MFILGVELACLINDNLTVIKRGAINLYEIFIHDVFSQNDEMLFCNQYMLICFLSSLPKEKNIYT